ncbi:perosamine synthetase-related protein [Xenorhabdus sp. Reich]|uniref:Perosamine synthetase-related protein n=1 Tax=Xenorhabdus littoralis TaxID=2582835 RepID=A0ABU4SJM4_9GAMM|nr:DegT/DnrJ/EryC1/StrS family aminotransferase [Xenorhabdus sp. Reich]MDX7998860.1 perosamine synthetase-related protein [Xenorhabdus sp. Reich]
MITKSAHNPNNCSLNLIFTKNARTAWNLILHSLKSERELNLLLPSYIGRNDKEGSGVYDAVLNHNITSSFYKIGNQLEVDIIDFEKSILENNINLALIIHYFGFCRSDMIKIRNICDKNNVILVEDCAHAFHLGKEKQLIGNYGDFSFYSIHKYLATESGGILKKNNNKYNIAPPSSEEDISLQALKIYSNSDFKKIGNSRRKNFNYYSALLNNNKNLEIIFKLDHDDIPQSFPIRIKNELREKLYFYLLKNNLPTISLYYRLIDEIDLKKFVFSEKISNEILNLPVHQDTTKEDIIKLCNNIEAFFNEQRK